MSILDAYKTDVEINGNFSNNYDLPDDALIETDCDKEQYKTALDEMRRKMDEYDTKGTIDGDNVEIKDVTEEHGEDPYKEFIKNNEDDVMARFMEEYPFTAEASLNTVKQDVKPMVVRAYCPVCGEEIVCKVPVLYNPFSLQKVVKYQCNCGWKANLEYTYPKVVFVNGKGEELECYGK